MTLLLPFLLGMVGLGLVTDKLDRRTYLLILGSAVLATILFYLLRRFWT